MTKEAPIWVYYENIATQETLKSPERVDGDFNTQYTIDTPDISEFTYVDNSGELTGVFGNAPQSLHLYYRPKTWRDVHRVTMYIALKSDVVAQAMPNDYAHNTSTLLSDSYWATPLRVISGNGQFWYQVGTHAWVRYDASLMTLSDTAPNVENIHYIQDLDMENDQPNAVVDFLPGQSTEIFESPYGFPTGSVADGDLIAIAKEQQHDNGLIWYKIANSGWINSMYINKL